MNKNSDSNKKLDGSRIVAFLAGIIAIVAWYISYSTNNVLTYNDAASHLNIGRRIVDNLTPGIAQIGTVWLPLPHVLMLLTAWNDFMWHSALAGSIVSMASFVIAVVYTYKLILLMTEKRSAAVVGSLFIAFNPNLLYLSTTPMTESLLMATFTLSSYYIATFIQSKDVSSLILAGVFVMMSTLTRYDGWFLLACVSGLLYLWSLATVGRKKAEGNLLLFACIGGFGIVLWVLWNKMIFGDPLYFITGPYSAYAQQKVLSSVGQLPTKGNVLISMQYYFWAMVSNNGGLIVVSSLLGLLISPFIVKTKHQLIILTAVFSPLLFNILALFLGQSAMNVPQAAKDPGLFNIRYGILMLPAFAVMLGIVASKKFAFWIVTALFFIQSFLFIRHGTPISLEDGQHGLQNTLYTVESSKWLAEHYESGLILTSLASHDAFVARAQMPMKLYIHEGTREYWDNALKRPSASAAYIATMSYPPDLVYRAIKNNPDFLNNYTLVHSYGTFGIYKRK